MSGANVTIFLANANSRPWNLVTHRALAINVEIVLQQAKNVPFRSLSLLDHRAD